MLWTTLRILRKNGACREGYAQLRGSLPSDFGQDEPIPLAHGLCTNGLQDTLWALSAVHPDCEKERDRIARLAACEFAEAVLPIFEKAFPNDGRPREAINIARRFARSEASSEEMDAARDAARDAAWAAWDAARDAARAAGDAAWAAGDAARDAQKEILLRYLTRGE